MYLRKKGMTVPIAACKSLIVNDDCVKIDVVYGKRVQRNYVVSFSHEEWILMQRKVSECCTLLDINR